MEGAGLVEKIGENVKGLANGTRVYLSGSITGTYAEQALCNVDHAHPLPDHLSFSQGAAVSVAYTTAYRALFQRGHANAGEIVLIHGATGGVGIAAVQLSKAGGMLVIGSGGSEKGRKLLLNEGADFVIDHQSPGHLDQVLTLTNGQGADVILEMLANVNLGSDLKALAKGGRVLIIGSRGKVEIDPRDLMSREAAILGVYIMTKDEKKSAHCAIGAGLANRSLRPIVGREIPLREAPRSHQEVMQSGAYGKIVLVP
jgi:NADPH2:quinone reductase